MTRNRAASFDIGHPAPGKSRVGSTLLLATFLAGFVAWSLQLAATSSIAGLACLEASTRTGDSEIGWSGLGVEVINLAALAIAIGAVVLSGVLIRRTREADPKPEGGVMQAGEGRARFMAVWGLFANLLFSAAIASNTISVFWGGLCPV